MSYGNSSLSWIFIFMRSINYIFFNKKVIFFISLSLKTSTQQNGIPPFFASQDDPDEFYVFPLRRWMLGSQPSSPNSD